MEWNGIEMEWNSRVLLVDQVANDGECALCTTGFIYYLVVA
jgi:hypothetical protein